MSIALIGFGGIYFKTDTLEDFIVIGGISSTRNAPASILRDLLNI